REHKVLKSPFGYDAPLLIVCCADPSLYPASTEVDDTPENYALIDLSIAVSFLNLRATELGLGAVFVAWIYRDRLREALNIPDNYVIPYVLPIGYPAEDPAPRTRKNLKEIVF
ncbi:MAG: nitroreductase family protein, partial [Candidatus Nanoarchaeia archaeon]